jgi:hypothetical protein
LSVSGYFKGFSNEANYTVSGRMQDTVTETNGVGLGTERFVIVFDWFSLDDPGFADAQASLSYNGVVVWSEDHPAPGHTDAFNHESIATVDEPFTFGQPFTFEAIVTASGGPFGFSSLALSNGTLSVTNSDLLAVPEPSTWLSVLVGFGLLRLKRSTRSRHKPTCGSRLSGKGEASQL